VPDNNINKDVQEQSNSYYTINVFTFPMLRVIATERLENN